MTTHTWTRVAAGSGLLHVIVVLIGVAIHQGSPDVGASAHDVATYVVGVSSTQAWIGNYVEGVGYLLFLLFATFLYSAFPRTAPSWKWFSVTALAAAIMYVTMSVGPGIALQEATVQWGKRGVSPQVVAALSDMADDVFFLSFIPVALFLGAVAVLAWWTNVLPRWLGMFAAGTAVLVLIAGALANLSATHGAAMLAFLVFSLWIVVTSITLLVRPGLLDASEGVWEV
jgi:hypothetical protein